MIHWGLELFKECFLFIHHATSIMPMVMPQRLQILIAIIFQAIHFYKQHWKTSSVRMIRDLVKWRHPQTKVPFSEVLTFGSLDNLFLWYYLWNQGSGVKVGKFFFFFFFFKRFYLFIFRQRGREGERGKRQCVVATRTPPAGDLALNPGIVPWVGIQLVTLWFADWFSFFIYIYLLIMLLQLSHSRPPPPLNSILLTPSLPHSPSIVHIHGSYL